MTIETKRRVAKGLQLGLVVGVLVGLSGLIQTAWLADPIPALAQTVTVDSTQSPLVVNALADLADLTPTDGQSVIIKTGTEKGLWYYDKDSVAVVDSVAVLTGPGSVGRFLVINNDAGSIAAATAITAAQIDNDVDLEFGVFDADSARSLTLAELKKTGVQVVNVKQYGATGGGVTDDTAEIQAAIDAAKGTGTPVVIPHGTYLTSTQITIDDDLTMIVYGNITYSGSDPAFAITGTVGSTYTLSTDYDQGVDTIVVTSATGLAIGDYLTINDPLDVATVTSHYRIENLSGTTVTLDRPLTRDVESATAVVTEYSPVSVKIIGNRSTFTCSNNTPKAFEMEYAVNSTISGFDFVFTGSESSASATVNYATRVVNCDRCTVSDLSYTGLTGGNEFCHFAVDYSSDCNVERLRINAEGGKCKGIENRYSTNSNLVRCVVNRCGSDVGAIFCYGAHLGSVERCSVNETTASTGGATGMSGIQVTSSEGVSVSRNAVVNPRGEAAVYVSGASADVIIESNQIRYTTADSTNLYAGIALRSGSNITVSSNRVHVDKEVPAISVAGIAEFTVTGNVITGNNIGIHCNKRGSDPSEYAYYPRRGMISGNRMNITSTGVDALALYIGTLTEYVSFMNNSIKMTSTNDSASVKWGALIDGVNNVVKNNHLQFIFDNDASNTNVYPIQITGRFNELSDNTIVYGKYTSPIVSSNDRNLVGKNRIQRILVSATQAASTDLTTTAAIHSLAANDIVYFTPIDGGTLGAGISAGTAYYVIATDLTTTAFKVSTTLGGAAVDITADSTGSIVVYTSRLRWVYCTGTTLEYRDNEFFAARKRGTTAQRPTLTTDDAGFMYRDTDTTSIVTWTGSAWE